jgi:hypothetical protein
LSYLVAACNRPRPTHATMVVIFVDEFC